MTGISTGPKLFLPGLVPLYRHIVPLSWLDGGRPTALRAQVALTAEGTYVVRWQVLSDDGHITRGTVSFRVGSTAARR